MKIFRATLMISDENDFRRGMGKTVKECCENWIILSARQPGKLPHIFLLGRREAAYLIYNSPVAFPGWLTKGVPSGLPGNRVYYRQTGVITYFNQSRRFLI